MTEGGSERDGEPPHQRYLRTVERESAIVERSRTKHE